LENPKQFLNCQNLVVKIAFCNSGFIEKRKWPSGLNWKYPNDHFRILELVYLSGLISFPACGQLYWRALGWEICQRLFNEGTGGQKPSPHSILF